MNGIYIDKTQQTGDTKSSMFYTAAIDIGSNAVRLAIAKNTDSGPHVSYVSRQPVRLGSSAFSQGNIENEIYLDLKTALLQFKNQLENYNVSQCRAVATSAMREAANNQEILLRLKKETGLVVEIIDGQEEARLVGLAISKKMDLKQGRYLLIDIGGGSIELVAVVDGQTRKNQSYKIGVVRILELQKNKKREELDSWLPDFIQKEIHDFFTGLPQLESAVGTGGNMDRFMKLKPFVSNEQRAWLTIKEMKAMHKILNQVDYKERISKFNLKPDRADVILPAAIITNQIMTQAGAKKIHFPQVGLKDGLLHELFQNHKK